MPLRSSYIGLYVIEDVLRICSYATAQYTVLMAKLLSATIHAYRLHIIHIPALDQYQIRIAGSNNIIVKWNTPPELN